MANQPIQRGIANSWSLIAFARSHGKMQVGNFSHTDPDTGEVSKFKSCIFTNPDDNSRCFVAFSPKLGELTPEEIVAMKDELQVVQLEESGNYSLCRKGGDAWQDVELGI